VDVWRRIKLSLKLRRKTLPRVEETETKKKHASRSGKNPKERSRELIPSRWREIIFRRQGSKREHPMIRRKGKKERKKKTRAYSLKGKRVRDLEGVGGRKATLRCQKGRSKLKGSARAFRGGKRDFRRLRIKGRPGQSGKGTPRSKKGENELIVSRLSGHREKKPGFGKEKGSAVHLQKTRPSTKDGRSLGKRERVTCKQALKSRERDGRSGGSGGERGKRQNLKVCSEMVTGTKERGRYVWKKIEVVPPNPREKNQAT